MSVAIIDYGSGNLRSVQNALLRAAGESAYRGTISITADPNAVRQAERIVLPGVGAFADCRAGLDAVSGMVEALIEGVRQKGRPFLGICVGMQLLAREGLEKTTSLGLDWIGGVVKKLAPEPADLKIPHMGWNTLDLHHPHPVMADIPTGEDGLLGYFVHSYRFIPDAPSDLLASTDYGGPLAAMIARDNIVGTQFHPEKSQGLGLALLANFLKWRP